LVDVPGFHGPILDYVRSLTGLGHKLMVMYARGLRLPDSYFVDRYTGNPMTSFGIFNYPQIADGPPADGSSEAPTFTASGFLAIRKQDGSGGLEIKHQGRWLELPDIPNSFVCNVGDMLARLTNCRYVSAQCRVRNSIRDHRLSMPFSFGPASGVALEPIVAIGPAAPRTINANADVLSGRVRRHLALLEIDSVVQRIFTNRCRKPVGVGALESLRSRADPDS
jgi:isopenicillin N synthase-like dioxygenase